MQTENVWLLISFSSLFFLGETKEQHGIRKHQRCALVRNSLLADRASGLGRDALILQARGRGAFAE